MSVGIGRRLGAALLVAALLSFAASPAWADTSVRFEILSKSGKGAKDASIYLTGLKDPLTTNKDGHADITLAPGVYRAKVRHANRELVFSKIEIPESDKQVTVRLRLRW